MIFISNVKFSVIFHMILLLLRLKVSFRMKLNEIDILHNLTK